VGTTGDYKPFTFLNPASHEYEGLDIDAAKLLADSLGVNLVLVQTTWPTLLKGLQENQYDLAMGGITRTLARQKVASLTHPYLRAGKSPLIRVADQGRFRTLGRHRPAWGEDRREPRRHQPAVPGRQHQEGHGGGDREEPQHPREGRGRRGGCHDHRQRRGDAAAKLDPRLYAVDPDNTYTKDDLGYLLPRDDHAWLDYVNLWVDLAEMKGDFARLRQKWLR
jgi:cyclohexadienyl dehydratase